MRALLAALPLAITATAWGQSSERAALHLSWVRSDSAAACPDAARVMADVEARLGMSPFTPEAGRNGALEVTVTRQQAVFRADISMRDAAGTLLGSRRVESRAESCDSLASAAALAIALMIQPDLITRDPPPEPQPKPAAKPTPAAPPPSRPSQPTSQRSVFVAAGVSAVANALPELSAGPVLRAGVVVAPRLVLSGGAHFMPQQWLENSATRTAFGLTLGSLDACLRFPVTGALALSSCGTFVAGAMHVAVAAPRPVDPGDGLWLAAGCGLALTVAAGPAELSLGATALGHWARRDYRVERAGGAGSVSAYTEPALAGLSSITLGTRL